MAYYSHEDLTLANYYDVLDTQVLREFINSARSNHTIFHKAGSTTVLHDEHDEYAFLSPESYPIIELFMEYDESITPFEFKSRFNKILKEFISKAEADIRLLEEDLNKYKEDYHKIVLEAYRGKLVVQINDGIHHELPLTETLCEEEEIEEDFTICGIKNPYKWNCTRDLEMSGERGIQKALWLIESLTAKLKEILDIYKEWVSILKEDLMPLPVLEQIEAMNSYLKKVIKVRPDYFGEMDLMKVLLDYYTKVELTEGEKAEIKVKEGSTVEETIIDFMDICMIGMEE